MSMKKIYSILAIACTTLSLTAGETAELKVSEAVTLKAGNVLTKAKDARGTKVQNAKLKKSKAQTPAKAPEADDWASIGKGIYLEDLFTNWSNIETGWHWEVEVETSESNPGWYRLQPYSTGTIAEMMEEADLSYMYINASNPEKVYAEDLIVYDNFMFSQCVVENEWEDADDSCYGKIENGVISFPTEAFLELTQAGWQTTSSNTGVRVYLPGSEFDFKNYTFKAVGEYCGDDNASNVYLTLGADVASYKALVYPGYLSRWSDGFEAVVLGNGQSVPASTDCLQFTPTARGIYTTLLVALNAAGETVGNAIAWTYWNQDNDEDWQDYGTCVITEGLYSWGYNLQQEELTVSIQEHKTRPGYFRIPNAYADHSEVYAVEHDTHTHYLYINAENPDYAFIEPSALGSEISYGNGVVFSLGHLFYGTEAQETAKELNLFGTYDKASDTITFPEESLAFGEEEYDNGSFIEGANDEMSFALSKTSSGLQSLPAASSAPAEYFNLQGMRVDAPAAGSLLIRRQGGTVEKIRF